MVSSGEHGGAREALARAVSRLRREGHALAVRGLRVARAVAPLARGTVCAVALCAWLVGEAEAGRKRSLEELVLYIRGTAEECPVGGLERVFQVAGPGGWYTWANVFVGDCVTLPRITAEAFRLCCIDETRCVDYYTPCTEPPQCVSDYRL